MYKSSTHEVFLDILLLRLQNKSDTDISEFLDKHDGEFLAMSANHPFVSKINWLTFKEGDLLMLLNCNDFIELKEFIILT